MFTLVIFLLILGLLVLVHELGHFVAARKNGIKVEEFGFGFPPRLFGIQLFKEERLEKIAEKFYTSVKTIKEDNKQLQGKKILRIGQSRF